MPVTPASAKNSIDGATNAAAGETKDFAERLSDGVSNATDYVADGVKSATAQLPRMGEWVDEKLARVSDAVQEKPLQTLAITAGIAALFGALFLRR